MEVGSMSAAAGIGCCVVSYRVRLTVQHKVAMSMHDCHKLPWMTNVQVTA